MSMSSENK